MALSIMLFSSLRNTASAQPGAGTGISYQTFYDELDPYGQWMDYPDYGYVWIPDAGPDFRPYSTDGHWVWSDDYEWMWVSDYDWGWAPFHYGRWLYDSYYGWMWVPGYEWSPAWVAWRDGGDYYGWAPLRPGINIGINFSIGSYNPPIDYWCFAPRRYITSPRIYDYCVPRYNNVTIINNTTIINNYNYNRNIFRTGPGRRDAERYAGRINSVRFRESSNPGRTRFRDNEVSIYRPNVQRDNNNSFAPRRFERFDRDRQNNGNTIRRNGNDLPQRREINNDRNFDRKNNAIRQGDRDNGIADRKRNVITRDNNNSAQPGNQERRNRRFENPDNNNRPAERRDVLDRNNNNNRQAENNDRQRKSFERQQSQNNDRRIERRDVYNRNNNNPQPERREMRNNNERPQRQTSPQMEQRRQEQPRQFERRKDNNNNTGGNTRRESGKRNR